MTNDLISRQAVIDSFRYDDDGTAWNMDEIIYRLEQFPSVQPESISKEYAKAVWTWLLDYQIKAAELKGRYTPYEVLSWVANDWRKEND